MPGKKESPHNNYFIERFSTVEFATSFFQEYLPEKVKQAVNWKKLKLAPGDFVQKALRNRRSDILYETEISDRKGFFYLHLEHQRKSDPNMALRMLEYMISICRQHEKQYPKEKIPIVFPMVLFQGVGKWNAPLTLHEFLDVPKCMKPYVPEFRYELLDLSHLTDKAIRGTLLMRVGMLVMKHIDSPDITEYLFENLLPLFDELSRKNKTGIEYLESAMYYLFKAGKHLDKETVIKQFQALPDNTKTKEITMTVAEQLIQEGMQQGIQQGMQQGILEGEIQLVLALLQEKFGKKVKDQEGKLRKLSLDDLNKIARLILTADKIEDIF